MKILKIDNGCGYFRKVGDGDWFEIDTIDKHALLSLLNMYLENDAQMDDPSENELSNEVHKIVYSNIFEKLSALAENKPTFKDESERLYIDELKKYAPS